MSCLLKVCLNPSSGFSTHTLHWLLNCVFLSIVLSYIFFIDHENHLILKFPFCVLHKVSQEFLDLKDNWTVLLVSLLGHLEFLKMVMWQWTHILVGFLLFLWNTMTEKQVEEESIYLAYTSILVFIIKGNQGRNLNRAGTQSQELMAGAMVECCLCLQWLA